LDFDVYLAAKTRDFIGRDWLVAEVTDHLADTAAAPALLITGEPGWGKTAFSAQLFRNDPGGRLLAAHFCRADRSDTRDPVRFVENLIAMASMRSPECARVLQAAKEVREGERADPKEWMETLFLGPLTAADPAALGPLPRYILIDALDEAGQTPGAGAITDLIAASLPLFPPWLRVVATTRPTPEILTAFGGSKVLRLADGDPRNLSDIRRIIDREVSEAPAAAELAALLEAKAAGNALCAAQLALAARRSGFDQDAVAQAPRELGAIYLRSLKQRFDGSDSEAWVAAREIFEMVLAAPMPIPIMVLAAARGDVGGYATRTAVEHITDLLQIHGDDVRLFHQTFADFLVDRSHPFFADPTLGAARLADLTLIEEKRASLTDDQRAFCDGSVRPWISSSRNPVLYGGRLGEVYGRAFRRDYPLYVDPDAQDLHDDLALMAAFARRGALDPILGVSDLALSVALDHMTPALTRAANHPATPVREETAVRARDFQAAGWLTCFALVWIEQMGSLSPRAKPRLLDQMKKHHLIFSAFGYLGSAFREYGVSSYFESLADFVCSEHERLALQLTAAGGAKP
jgi:hypothetical protein